MRTLQEVIAGMPAEDRARIAARSKQLIEEEMALRKLREAHQFTQQRMAELLHMDQGSVLKLESRTDMLLSTLRSYVEAMGGELRLVAEFPDAVAEIGSLGEALDIRPKKKDARKRRPEVIAP